MTIKSLGVIRILDLPLVRLQTGLADIVAKFRSYSATIYPSLMNPEEAHTGYAVEGQLQHKTLRVRRGCPETAWYAEYTVVS